MSQHLKHTQPPIINPLELLVPATQLFLGWPDESAGRGSCQLKQLKTLLSSYIQFAGANVFCNAAQSLLFKHIKHTLLNVHVLSWQRL